MTDYNLAITKHKLSSGNCIIGYLFFLISISSLIFSGINIDLSPILWGVFSLMVVFFFQKECRTLIFGKGSDFTYIPFLFLFLLLICFEPLQYILLNGYVPYWEYMHNPTIEAKNTALSMASLFLGCVYFFKPPMLIEIKYHKTHKIPSNNKFIMVCLVLFVIGVIPYLASGKQILAILIAGRSNSGFSQFDIVALGNKNFLPFFANFLIGVSLYTGYFLIINKGVSYYFKLICILLFLLSSIFIVSGGGRTRLGFVVIPLIMMYFLYNKNKTMEIIKGFAVVGMIIILISVMVQIRTNNIVADKNEEIVLIDMSGSNLNREVIFISEHYDKPIACDALIECLMLPYIDTLNKFLTNPIPRFLWSGKYLDPSFANYNIARTGSTGFEQTSNVTATCFGRYYILYGWYGVIAISIIFSILLRFISNSFNKNNELFDVIFIFQLAYYIAQSLRDFNPGWLYPVIFTYICKKIIEKTALKTLVDEN